MDAGTNKTTLPCWVTIYRKLVKQKCYPIVERKFISDIIRHFPKSLQQLWLISKGESVTATTGFLRTFDDVDKQGDIDEAIEITRFRCYNHFGAGVNAQNNLKDKLKQTKNNYRNSQNKLQGLHNKQK